MARIEISPLNRLDLIAEAAGQPDPKKRLYVGGFLEVEGVTQQALEIAAARPQAALVDAWKKENYAPLREQELKRLDGEGMDAIRKEIAALRAGEPETEEYAAYKAKVEEVKERLPKGV